MRREVEVAKEGSRCLDAGHLMEGLECCRNVGVIGVGPIGQLALERCLKPWLVAPTQADSGKTGTGGMYRWQDCRIHMGISPTTRSELRMYDGAVVVIEDSISREIRELVLKAAQEGIRTVYLLPRLDALIDKGSETMEHCLDSLLSAIQTISAFCDSSDYTATVEAGTVLLASWGLDYSVPCSEFPSSHEFCLRLAQSSSPRPSLGEALFRMIRDRLPSPDFTSIPRLKRLLGKEDREDQFDCSPSSPLCLYIGKVSPGQGKNYAVGRVFAGTIGKDSAVYVSQQRRDNIEYSPLLTYISTNDTEAGLVEQSSFSPGSILTVSLTNDLIRAGTIITDSPTIKYCVGEVERREKTVRATLEPAKPSSLPLLISALASLRITHPDVSVNSSEPREIHATDTTSLLSAVTALRSALSPSILVQGDIVPIYRETIQAISSQTCLVKSANKHSRLYCTAEPLTDAYLAAMENTPQTAFARKRILWRSDCNELTNATKGVQHVDEIACHLSSGFQYFCRYGALCEEPVRGVRVVLEDMVSCVDAIHRGGGQLIPATRRVCLACQLVSQPALLEPVLHAEILTPYIYSADISTLIAAHRGYTLSTEAVLGSALCTVKAAIPSHQLCGLEAGISAICRGAGSLDVDFYQWTAIPGDPTDPHSEAGRLVRSIRKRKGLPPDLPPLSVYLDHL